MSGFEMAEEAAANYEDVTMFDLDSEVEEQLLQAQTECSFVWSNKEGWPVGVIMSYVWRDGRFWLTASGQRARVAAVRRDPRVCIIVSSAGSSLDPLKTVTWKGICTVHDDDETKAWFYPALCDALQRIPDDPEAWVRFIDTPRRVILEVEPTQRIGHDGGKVAQATAQWLSDSK
jgi:general stress protein 26